MRSDDHSAADDSLPISPAVMTFEPGSDGDARKRLRRNRRLATGLLLSMVAIAIGTWMVPHPGFATLLIRSGSEAGVVGGLADWFAVTALFRQPLGLPIPHTAIIPHNKERIGRALGRFVERNFLTREVLLARLRQMQAGRRVAAWLADPGTASLVASAVAKGLPYVIRSLRSREIREFVQRSVGEQLQKADIAPLLGRALQLLTSTGEADPLFEQTIGIAVRWLEDNRGQIDRLIGERSPWWIPKTIDRRIAAALYEGITDLLGELRRPESAARGKFRDALAATIDEMLHSQDRREEINAAKNRFFMHPTVQAWLVSVWRELCSAALSDLRDSDSRLRTAVGKTVSALGAALNNDEPMQLYIDGLVENAAIYVIDWRGEIGSFIAEVIRNWDTATLSARLELAVGSDLQYIRMNGTIVGAFAGCLIFLVTWLFA